MRYGRILLLLTLFLVWALPVQAAPPADYQPFARAAWGLSLAHPPDWSLVSDREDAVILGWWTDTDQAAVIVSRDPAWRDRTYDLQAMLADIVKKTEGNITDTRLEAVRGRVVAGALARAGILRFADPTTKREVEAHLFVLARNGVGYAIVEAAFTDTWPDHAADFAAILDSVHIGAPVEPASTP